MKLENMIDHTVLKPEAVKSDVERLCREARDRGFASVCVNPCHVRLVSEQLRESNVKTCCVISFPLGASTTETKVFETENAIANGADEVDMVINIGALKERDETLVYRDIKAVTDAAKGKALVKVIIEACLLTDEEKVLACKLCATAGVDFVKTSTGFSTGGATAEDVSLMKQAAGADVKVKASGGIRTRDDAERMVKAGADRIGTSNGMNF